MWLLTSTQIFAATINITLQKSDQALSINFFHEKDLFPVFSYEKNSITARFYRAISHINTDANFNKLASIQYTQKDKRAIKIMLPNKHYRAETKTGTTHSLINLYTEKEPLKAPQNKNLVYTYADDNTNPVISIPHSFDSLAIFKRNTELWIAMTGNVKSLTFGSKDKLKFRSIKSQDALILACDIGKLEYQKLRYGPNQTVEILLGNDASQITKQNDIEYEECKDQHIWKILSDYKICKVQDEQTKEHINIVTVKDLVFGQNQEQVFEDFHLQKSLQGLVFVWKAQPCLIIDKANQIIVKKQNQKMRIFT